MSLWKEGCWWPLLTLSLALSFIKIKKKRKRKLPYDAAIPLLGIYSENTITQKDTYLLQSVIKVRKRKISSLMHIYAI